MSLCKNYDKCAVLCYIGEEVKKYIENEEAKELAEKNMEMCWRFTEGDEIDINDFCMYLDSPDDDGFLYYMDHVETEKDLNILSILLGVVSYITADAGLAQGYSLPQYLEVVDEEYYADVIADVLKLDLKECSLVKIEKVKAYCQDQIEKNSDYIFTAAEILDCVD